jgi:subtilisin family serine protease
MTHHYGAAVFVLLLVLMNAAVSFRPTIYPRPGPKRSLIQGAEAQLQFHARIRCSLAEFETDHLQSAFTAGKALATLLTDDELFFTPGAVPCQLTETTVNAVNTFLVMECAFHLQGLEAVIASFLRDTDALPQECRDRVVFVILDKVLHVNSTTQTTPRNTHWFMDRVDQRERPLSGSYTYELTGTGILAYIIDTGVRADHVEFGGRASNVYNAIGDGIDTDCDGHGTHVAGTLGGATVGICKACTLLACKALNCQGQGTFSSVMTCLAYVEDAYLADPDVGRLISMSLAGDYYAPINNYLTELIDNDHIAVIVAAGNAASNAASFSPASTAAALTVAATSDTDSDAPASFSNGGSIVDIAAPGVNIRSAGIASTTAYVYLSGTSMAAPLVSGVTALYMHAQNVSAPDGKAAMATVKAAATANKVTNPLGSGYPRLGLVFSAAGSPSVPQPPPAPPPQPPAGPNPFPPPTTGVQPFHFHLNSGNGVASLLIEFLGSPLFIVFILLIAYTDG